MLQVNRLSLEIIRSYSSRIQKKENGVSMHDKKSVYTQQNTRTQKKSVLGFKTER